VLICPILQTAFHLIEQLPNWSLGRLISYILTMLQGQQSSSYEIWGDARH